MWPLISGEMENKNFGAAMVSYLSSETVHKGRLSPCCSQVSAAGFGNHTSHIRGPGI